MIPVPRSHAPLTSVVTPSATTPAATQVGPDRITPPLTPPVTPPLTPPAIAATAIARSAAQRLTAALHPTHAPPQTLAVRAIGARLAQPAPVIRSEDIFLPCKDPDRKIARLVCGGDQFSLLQHQEDGDLAISTRECGIQPEKLHEWRIVAPLRHESPAGPDSKQLPAVRPGVSALIGLSSYDRLPDGLPQHIISFLELHALVRMSMVSRSSRRAVKAVVMHQHALAPAQVAALKHQIGDLVRRRSALALELARRFHSLSRRNSMYNMERMDTVIELVNHLCAERMRGHGLISWRDLAMHTSGAQLVMLPDLHAALGTACKDARREYVDMFRHARALRLDPSAESGRPLIAEALTVLADEHLLSSDALRLLRHLLAPMVVAMRSRIPSGLRSFNAQDPAHISGALAFVETCFATLCRAHPKCRPLLKSMEDRVSMTLRSRQQLLEALRGRPDDRSTGQSLPRLVERQYRLLASVVGAQNEFLVDAMPPKTLGELNHYGAHAVDLALQVTLIKELNIAVIEATRSELAHLSKLPDKRNLPYDNRHAYATHSFLFPQTVASLPGLAGLWNADQRRSASIRWFPPSATAPQARSLTLPIRGHVFGEPIDLPQSSATPLSSALTSATSGTLAPSSRKRSHADSH